MTAEAELLANLPADGVRVWHLKGTRRYHATNQNGSSYWSFNHIMKEWSGPFSGDEDGIKIYTDSSNWKEVTPAPSLRDQRIAEAWKRWPDGRLFEAADSTPSRPVLRICRQGCRFMGTIASKSGAGWLDMSRNKSVDSYLLESYWLELPNPNTPPAPDPAGDLPDGTRVRVTVEGTTKGWQYGAGRVYGGDADPQDYATFNSNADCVTIEILALPEPKPSALDGEPGSLWRDPETGCTYARTLESEASSRPLFSLVDNWAESVWHLSQGQDDTIARLVPAEVADHG